MEELRQATNNFDMDNTIGHGSHGTVYTGLIKDMPVVIKREWCSPQPRFLDEVHTNKKLVISLKIIYVFVTYCCMCLRFLTSNIKIWLICSVIVATTRTNRSSLSIWSTVASEII